MPLIRSKKKEAIGKNIAELRRAGKPQSQAVAIALDVAREAGSKMPKKKEKDNPHSRSKEESVESILDFLTEGARRKAPRRKKEEEEDEALVLAFEEFE